MNQSNYPLLSRRQLLGTAAVFGTLSGGATADSSRSPPPGVGQGGAQLGISVRRNEPPKSAPTYIDVTLRGTSPSGIDTWLLRFGTGTVREAQTLAGLLHKVSGQNPLVTTGYVTHVYNEEGIYTAELVATQNDSEVLRATTDPFTITPRIDLVHGESWAPDILRPVDTVAHGDSWDPDIKPPFDSLSHTDSWDPDILPAFETAAATEPWDPDIEPAFDTVAHSEHWDQDIKAAFDTTLSTDDWEADIAPDFDSRVHQEKWVSGESSQA